MNGLALRGTSHRSVARLEVSVQDLVVVSVAPWVPIPGSHVAAKNETRDNRTSRYESNNASLSCQFYFKKIHFYSLTSFKVSHSESRRVKSAPSFCMCFTYSTYEVVPRKL